VGAEASGAESEVSEFRELSRVNRPIAIAILTIPAQLQMKRTARPILKSKFSSHNDSSAMLRKKKRV
jgi:hypothetical protein